ncbi:hypothetical protein C8J56DRAFT_871468 [Mycena floridula]|nr:hypothetical protein C8J56DRAFT_871468 [Mycena floridula]
MFSQQFRDVVLPIALFTSLSAVAANFLFGNLMLQSGLAAHMSASCPWSPPENPGDYPYRLKYTGILPFDTVVCMLCSFFQYNVNTKISPFFIYFSACGLVLNLIPALEARRRGGSPHISHTIILGIMTKLSPVAVVLPLYWLLMILTGAPKARDSGLSRNDVESVLFSIIVGHILPTIAMFFLDSPHAIAIWHYAPVWIFLAQKAWSQKTSEPAIQMLRKTWLMVFVIGAAAHIHYVWPKDKDSLKAFILPSLYPDRTTLEEAVYDFMKWDFLFGFASVILASLWFVGDWKKVALAVAWYSVALPLLGPGAAVAAVALWRDTVVLGSNVEENPVRND